ncbi:MAG: hypothetical protein CMH84_07860 [Nocardioides sp.]|nr:hypothetical protein [Nocardioides sp.]|tara:strand:+ start:8390 stop:8725 length:336 start_codon:yes stop_codon:yes gene_type:complete
MFTGITQRAQQFAISRARALETGRSVIVASTNGISGVIAPDGTVTQRSSTRNTEALVTAVPLTSDQAVAVRIGTMLTYGMIVIAFMALLAAVSRGDRTADPRAWLRMETAR